MISKLNSKTAILFFIFLLFFAGKGKMQKWKIISTNILLTSDVEDKRTLYTSCKNKYILLSSDQIFFKGDCLFDEKIQGGLSKYRKISYKNLCTYFDNTRLTSLLAVKGNLSKSYFLSTVTFKSKHDEKDSCNIILNDLRNKMLIVYEPYVLILKCDSK